MAKTETQVNPEKTKHILKDNVGSNKDGSPKKAKGDSVLLSEEQVSDYKLKKLI